MNMICHLIKKKNVLAYLSGTLLTLCDIIINAGIASMINQNQQYPNCQCNSIVAIHSYFGKRSPSTATTCLLVNDV